METNKPEQIAVELVNRILAEFTYEHEHRRVFAEAVGRSFVIKIQLHRADTPRAVGERGSHIQALDRVVAAVGNKSGVNMRAQLIEPEVGEKSQYGRFKPATNWNREGILKLLTDIGNAVFLGKTSVRLHEAGGTDITSSVELHVERTENRQLVEVVAGALKILFNAIGKANGRLLFLDVVSDT
jgi:predicted RNA-binding protein YlqC (UPF0109 family)